MEINSQTSINAGGRIWIELGDDASIGFGKIKLLETAARLGSLRQAAIEMNISYRQAWYKINQINKMSKQPLLVLSRGGKEGGSAVLTDFGKQIIHEFKILQKAFDSFLEKQSNKL